jgi:hypothetical protein
VERTELASFAHGLRQLPGTWNEFWFSPVTLGTMDRVRQLFALAIAFQFVFYLFWVPQWLSGDGWLGSQAGRYLIGQGMPDTGSQYRWSILYWLTSPLAGQAVCVIGFLASVLMFLGIGHRGAPILAWVCMMMVHHRAPWLTMPSEVLMSAGLFYLAIEPGASLLLKRSHKESADRYSVLANISLRCLQIHWVLWVGLSLASMLQQPVWWNGEAIGLLSEQGSRCRFYNPAWNGLYSPDRRLAAGFDRWSLRSGIRSREPSHEGYSLRNLIQSSFCCIA